MMFENFEDSNEKNTDLACQRLEDIHKRIDLAAESAGRKSSSVNLIAVSKTQPTSSILPIIHAGHKMFGENRIQEAQGKWPEIRNKYPDLELHLIGPLQSNKVRDAVELFDVIHTVDRPKIAGAIAREIERSGKQPRLFVQVNTGNETQKSGIRLVDVDKFLDQCRVDFKLNIAGLMCIPPVDEEPALHFALLRKIAENQQLSSLSMGMSADFETAVQFGATHVRVGTAIFGARQS